MVKIKRILSVGFLCIVFVCGMKAQTADVTSGCIPLEINFTSPTQNNYFWEFGDLASSNLQNPKHVFTSAGDFIVKLFDGVNGTLIGEIPIKVYPDPIVEIEATPLFGCSPLEVNFKTKVTIHPDVSVLSYLWTFGDGTSSTLENPVHTYQNAGIYPISVKIITSLTECNKTIIVDDLINVQGVASFFTLNKNSECILPATFNITNLSENASNLDYMWDFGNGEEFIGYDPKTITYNQKGTYTITLTVINEQGCESKRLRTVRVGAPIFDLTIKEYCINAFFSFMNKSDAVSYLWNFDPEPNVSNLDITEKNPDIRYSTGGTKTISLQITDEFNCTNDTTFTIEIQDPSPKFTIDPFPVNCVTPLQLTFKADDPTFSNYNWNISSNKTSSFTMDFDWPERDSLHLNWIDSLLVILQIETDIGCKATYFEWFEQRKPDAYFTVDQASGCAPLTVTFIDDTRSLEDVVNWHWIYGTGDEKTLMSGDPHSYVFENPGEYYCQLIIENDAGCIDTSAGLWILVGEQITSGFIIDKNEICLGESISISMDNLDSKIDAWHIGTDENRFDHCWTSNSASHQFVHAPGDYDLTLMTEYNGCYWQETFENAITVNGAKANLSYMTNCEDPFSVMFQSNSLGETNLQWDFPGITQYTESSFTHTFNKKDTFTVYLTAFDSNSLCPESIDSAIIHIVKAEAKFDLQKEVCDNEKYTLDASNSIDVNNNCSKGYLWNLPANRPRELGIPTIEVIFPVAGFQNVTLIVEDINGCTDTLTQTTKSFGINGDFAFDKNNVCLPATINFDDISSSDTTIVSWEWSFGGTNPSTNHEFMESLDSIYVSLTLEDAIGCTETVNKSISVYEVTSTLSYDNGPGICVGEEINFIASDFTSQGSFLNFDWDFDIFGSGDNQTENVVFDKNGLFNIILNYTEDQSGCSGSDTLPVTVVNVPIADFSTEFDTLDEICHPAIIEFMNQSIIEGNVSYKWNFDNGITTNQINPFNSFAKGNYDVELIVSSIYGCKDTISKTYNLVGPEGELSLDKNAICKGDAINFTLINPIDVNSYKWVFGDGTTEENINPITHIFDFNPPGGITKVDLILKTVENGCEFILTEPINITEISADFEVLDSSYCEGQAFFINNSVGDIMVYNWDFGNGTSSTEMNPSVIYSDLGDYDVTLRISDIDGVCKDEITKKVNIETVNDFIFFPNIFTPNNDGINDFFNVVISPGYEEVVKVLTFRVYNRWGNLIYDNDSPLTGWDAIVNNSPAPAEVYAYFIELEIIDCNNKIKKGNVTIVR